MELPTRIELAEGEQLVMQWADGTMIELTAAEVRRACPCASCETFPSGFIMPAVRITDVAQAGAYGLRFTFSDGHNSGIYRYDYLKELGGKASVG